MSCDTGCSVIAATIVHDGTPTQALSLRLAPPKSIANHRFAVWSPHAAKPPTTRRAARRLARPRRGQIRRGLLLREVRRHPRAGDGDLGRPPAAVAERSGAR